MNWAERVACDHCAHSLEAVQGSWGDACHAGPADSAQLNLRDVQSDGG